MWLSMAVLLVPLTSGSDDGPPSRTTIVVTVDGQASWRDMAFLAAIPASEVANSGGASLLALSASEKVGGEVLNYFGRYRPTRVVLVAPKADSTSAFPELRGLAREVRSVMGGSAAEVSTAISRRFWTKSPLAVVVADDAYESALLAAPLASLRKAPLLVVPPGGPNAPFRSELRRLGVRKTLVVGPAIQGLPGEVVRLPDASAVVAWTRKERIPVRYLAAVNPQDRSNFVTRKLSMVGSQLASGRGGLVAPLSFRTEWKRTFATAPLRGALPSGVEKGKAPTLAGTLAVGADQAGFVLTGEDDDHGLRLWVDRVGGGAAVKAYESGDELMLDKRRWAVSLGKRTKFGESRVHLTWPTAKELRGRLERLYGLLGAPPEHLCLVGFPDALPHAIYGRGRIVEEQTSDLPYALVGSEPFAQIGVARLIAESLSFGTLYAARALTYPDLLDPAWSDASGQAEWETTMGPLFENVGFRAPYQLTHERIPWEVRPAEGQPGRRAASFEQGSPLASASVLAHSEHSYWKSLGSMFRWDATVLLAPTVVESGGCATTSLDREADNRSVVARLLRLGAVGFSGGSRELPAQTQPLRMAFWNGILAGETLGQAHRRALNAGLLVMMEEGEGPSGPYRYCTQVRMQFGDPALAIHLPSSPRVAPAGTVLAGNRLTVKGPGKWWVVKGHVPPDWEKWRGRDLFFVRGPGAFAMSNWTGEGRDQETLLVEAKFRSRRKVREIQPVQPMGAPLGWSGKWYSQQNLDGTYTTRFAVRMIDFDQVAGKIRKAVDQMEFRVAFQ